MKNFSLNAPAVHPHRMLRWAAVIAGMTVSFAMGLLTANSLSSTAERPHAAIDTVVNQPAPTPAVSEIVPSPVIEANPQFFYGAGDGNGYWADRPKP
jgi:hypothetical protein